MVDVSKSFSTSTQTVSDFFQRPGVGLYIPLYQREYSWDNENIDQLMEDICLGVEALITDNKPEDKQIRFLGTIILVQESSTNVNIDPKDTPPRIDKVIDGQQRISTISLLACLLYQRLYEISKKLPDEIKKEGVQEAVDTYLSILLEVFSFDLKRGLPSRKPIIIRESVDGWTLTGDDDKNYKSDVSSFLAGFIRAIHSASESEFPKPPQKSLVSLNIKRINSWLNKIEKAYEADSKDFKPAWEILENISQIDLWSYERSQLVCRVKERSNPMSDEQKKLCSIVQLIAVCHYLLQRCCFTLIEPKSDDWAFDMFQSLNATGTPLTALETFKPLVVNSINKIPGKEFKGSKFEDNLTEVEKFLGQKKSAASKNKLTNEYLTLFGTIYNGEKEPSRQFSSQRKWLIEKYKECNGTDREEEFIQQMAFLAIYYKEVINFDPNKLIAIPRTDKVANEDKKQAALCVLYLEDASHKMAHTILSRFYTLCLRDEPNSDRNFVLACKQVAAFFTLWRSALTNTGLDDVYRKLLKEKMSWQKGNNELNVKYLSVYLIQVLRDKGIGSKNDWKNKATQYLRYDNVKTVCKFVLFISSHDTIPDPSNPGLMKTGTSGSCPYLEPSKWCSAEFKSIEHIAPQDRLDGADWDNELYTSNDDYDKIGNLTLLPTEINSSAGNKRWIEKLIYYQHLAETDYDIIDALRNEAKNNGIYLNADTIELLKNKSYKHHIKPIVEVGSTGVWDKILVEKRTERICDIVWDRMYSWLALSK